MWRDAASAAAGGGVQRLQLRDDFLQLSAELQVSGGIELRPEMFKAIDGNGFPGLNQELGLYFMNPANTEDQHKWSRHT